MVGVGRPHGKTVRNPSRSGATAVALNTTAAAPAGTPGVPAICTARVSPARSRMPARSPGARVSAKRTGAGSIVSGDPKGTYPARSTITSVVAIVSMHTPPNSSMPDTTKFGTV